MTGGVLPRPETVQNRSSWGQGQRGCCRCGPRGRAQHPSPSLCFAPDSWLAGWVNKDTEVFPRDVQKAPRP